MTDVEIREKALQFAFYSALGEDLEGSPLERAERYYRWLKGE